MRHAQKLLASAVASVVGKAESAPSPACSRRVARTR
jgi:hypothetical protein